MLRTTFVLMLAALLVPTTALATDAGPAPPVPEEATSRSVCISLESIPPAVGEELIECVQDLVTNPR